MRSRLLTVLLALPLFLQLSGCGTLLFNERRGQPAAGKVDPNVLIMDGLLLFAFVVPGVVGFIVDYHTGALYLPRGVERGEGPILGEGGLFD